MVTTGLFGLAFIVFFVAVLSLGLAFLLDVSAKKLGLVTRSVIAAILAGFLTMIVPVAGVLRVVEGETLLVVLMPLLVLGIVLALLVGFPVAYFFGRRRNRVRSEPVKPEVFE